MSKEDDSNVKYPYSNEDNIEIKEIRLNNIAAFILFQINVTKSNDKNFNSNSFKRHLREFLLDFKDSLLAIGLNLPVVAVFENMQESQYYDLHELAGDQDWHRGDFSIVVSKEPIFERISIDHMPTEKGVSFKGLTFKEIAYFIKGQTAEIKEKDKDFEKFYIQFLETISENMEKESIERGFQLWKEKIKKQIEELRGIEND